MRKLFIVQILFSALFTIFALTKAQEQIETDDAMKSCEILLPGCNCSNFEHLIGLSCSNITDFSVFQNIVHSSLFPDSTIFEITIYGGKFFSRKAFANLVIYRLILIDVDVLEIQNNAFEGILQLGRILIQQSHLQKLPDLATLRNSLHTLNIDNSLLTALEGQGLQNLPKLQILSFMNNSISKVDPDVFKGTNNISVLDLSFNKLTCLPSTLLNSWKNLKKLALSHNQLLHLDNLFFVVYPKFIFLDSNNLTSIDDILFPNMNDVEVLTMSNNPISTVGPNTFNGKIPNVRSLFLDRCNITKFDVHDYEFLHSLSSLDISFNLIESIPEQRIEIGQNLELGLIGNKIIEFKGEISESVKSVCISENKLQVLGKTLQFSGASKIVVSFNQLQCLKADDFQGVRRLSALDLQGNRIDRIDTLTFLTLKHSLNHLDLSSNSLSHLNGSVRYLTNLWSLNLSSNLIQKIEEGEFTGLIQLSSLYLENNQILSLNLQFQQFPVLQFLDLRHNSIQSINQNHLPQSLQYLYLKGNPIKCNCKLLPFLRWLNVFKKPKLDINLCEVSKNKNTAYCPGPCSCDCFYEGNESFIFVNCSSRYMSVLPPFLTGVAKYWANNTLTVSLHSARDHPDFHIQDSVLSLSLENNNFHALEGIQLPSALRKLHLKNNKLEQLPDHVLYTLPKLYEVTLSSNPWKCGCNTLSLKTWLLSKAELVPDVNKTYCLTNGGITQPQSKLLLAISDSDLCPNRLITYLMIGSGILGLILVSSVIFIVHMRRKNSRFQKDYQISWKKVDDMNEDMEYLFDVFISFNDNESDIVFNEFLPILEKDLPDIRMYLPPRITYPAGETLRKNVISAMQSSRQVIVFLSREYLTCSWCTYQLQNASSELSAHDRLTIVEVGNLPTDMDKDVKDCFQHSTSLKWGEGNFWKKLFKILQATKESKKWWQNIFTKSNKSEEKVLLMKDIVSDVY